MTTYNLKAVPAREFGCMESVSDSIIIDMHRELSQELKLLRASIRDLGAKRNGLERVLTEMELREIGDETAGK